MESYFKFLQSTKYPNVHPRQMHFMNDIMACAALPGQSLNFFETNEFIRMVGRVDDNIVIPSRRSLARSIVAKAEACKRKVFFAVDKWIDFSMLLNADQ